MFLKNYSVPKIILLYLVSIITFVVSNLLLVLALTICFSLLSVVPIIGTLVALFFSFRGDSATLLTLILSIIISCALTKQIVFVFEKCNKLNQKISFYILGVTLIITGIAFIISNLSNQFGNSILNNILWFFAGIYFYYSARNIGDYDIIGR